MHLVVVANHWNLKHAVQNVAAGASMLQVFFCFFISRAQSKSYNLLKLIIPLLYYKGVA